MRIFRVGLSPAVHILSDLFCLCSMLFSADPICLCAVGFSALPCRFAVVPPPRKARPFPSMPQLVYSRLLTCKAGLSVSKAVPRLSSPSRIIDCLRHAASVRSCSSPQRCRAVPFPIRASLCSSCASPSLAFLFPVISWQLFRVSRRGNSSQLLVGACGRSQPCHRHSVAFRDSLFLCVARQFCSPSARSFAVCASAVQGHASPGNAVSVPFSAI